MAAGTASPRTPKGGLPTLLTLLASRPDRDAEQKMRRPLACAEIELLEEIEAGTPRLELFCKNTFLTAEEPMSPSLRPFYLERRVQTCPGARVGCLQRPFDSADAAAPSVAYQTPLAASPAAGVPPTPCYWDGAGPTAALSLADLLAPPPSVPPCVEQLTARVLSQAPPLWREPQSGAPSEPPACGLPSVGSALHGTGRCKPCAFLHTRGCEHGTRCEFCHSCSAGERKRRKQAKVEFLKATRKQRQAKE